MDINAIGIGHRRRYTKMVTAPLQPEIPQVGQVGIYKPGDFLDFSSRHTHYQNSTDSPENCFPSVTSNVAPVQKFHPTAPQPRPRRSQPADRQTPASIELPRLGQPQTSDLQSSNQNDPQQSQQPIQPIQPQQPPTRKRTPIGEYDKKFVHSVARINQLSDSVYNAIIATQLSVIFRNFVIHLRNECKSKMVLERHDPVRMWTQQVRNRCNKFCYQMYWFKQDVNVECPNVIIRYFETTSIIDVIQMFVDYAQVNYMYAEQAVAQAIGFGPNQDYVQTTRQIFNYYASISKLFLKLYHKCCGTDKPDHIRKNNFDNKKVTIHQSPQIYQTPQSLQIYQTPQSPQLHQTSQSSLTPQLQ